MSTLLKIAYKFRFLLSLFIAFFFGFFFLKLTCKASAVPSVDSSVFTVITNTATDMLDLGFVPQNLSPYSPISTNTWTPWQVGGALLSFDLNDCTTTELTADQKSALFESFTVVDYEDFTITVDNPIYCVKFDNGYFTGYCYVDDDGKLLYYSNDLGGQLMQIKYGGSIKSSEDWEDLYYNTATKIYDSNLTLYNDPDLIQDCSYYAFNGKRYNAMGVFYEFANYLFIPNQYQPGVIMAVPGNNGFINTWYFNSYDSFEYKVVFGSYNNGYTVNDGTYTLNGVSYTHQLRFQQFNPTTTINMTYQEWLNNGQTPSHGYFAMSGMFYNNNIDTSDEPVTFKPLDTSDDQQIINYNYYYSPTDLSSLEQSLSNIQSQLNNLYNPNNSISSQNYPIYYPATEIEASPSEIPFPNVINYPNFTPLPEASTDPALNYEAITQPANETVLQSFSNLQIPFLQNIRYRFPFCIPWDIRDALSLLQFSPTAPAWDFNWDIQVGTHVYRYHFAGDLSDFDSLALLFRRLTLCAVIIALAFWSYRIFF